MIRAHLERIEREHTQNLLNSLDTGVFEYRITHSSMQMSTIVANLTASGYAKELYKYCTSTFATYVTSKVRVGLRPLTCEIMLSGLVQYWEKYKILLFGMHEVFYSLDIYFVTHKDSEVLLLYQAGLKIFRALVLDPYRQKIQEAVIGQITKEREGQLIDRDLLKNSLLIFTQVGLTNVKLTKAGSSGSGFSYEGAVNYSFYDRWFESELLEVSRLYYAAKITGWMSSLSFPE